MKFEAVVQQHGKTATGIEIPEEIVEALGRGKRPPISVTINGHTYQSTVGVMGGKSLIPLSAEHRGNAGVSAGDTVEVHVELDTTNRTVEVPADLAAALKENQEARDAFEKLSNSGKKRHILSIEAAKTEETRQRRIARAVEELTAP